METLGKYKLIRRLAVGGMAEIFLAEQPGHAGFSRKVAIKRILPHRIDDADFVSMFLNEARLAAMLNHPNIVQIFDMGEADETYFIAMEYVEGYDLGQLLDRAEELASPLDSFIVAKIIARAAAGLNYAHFFKDPNAKQPLGLIHRDISLPNVMISVEGTVKVLDFGIAKSASSDSHKQTKTGVLKGKVSYMSPEYLKGRKIDWRHDLFALGVVLYELLTTEKPFKAKGEVQMLQAIMTQEVRDPRQFNPQIPEGLSRILMRMLEKDPDARYQSGEEIESALDQFIFSTQGQDISQTRLAGYVRDLFEGVSKVTNEAKAPSVASFSLSDNRSHKPAPSAPRRTSSGLQAKPANLLEDLRGLGSDESPLERTACLPGDDLIKELQGGRSSQPAWEETRALDASALLSESMNVKPDTGIDLFHMPASTPTTMLSLEDVRSALESPDLEKTQDVESAQNAVLTALADEQSSSEVEVASAGTEDSLEAVEEEEEESALWTVLALVLVLVVLGGGAYGIFWFFSKKNKELDEKKTVVQHTTSRIPIKKAKAKTLVASKGTNKAVVPRKRVEAILEPKVLAKKTKVAAKKSKVRGQSDDKNSFLSLSSFPSCSVYMAGYPMGKTPMRTKLPPGRYQLQLRKKRPYINYSFVVALGEGQHISRRIRIRRGRILIKLSPGKGKVYIDGNYLGTTPLSQIDLFEGHHYLKIQSSKLSRTIRKKIFVRGDRTRTYSFSVP